MKKLVLEITSHAGDGSVTHRIIETFPATLGRGYHNDIILSDPHVSAQHVRIEYDGDGWNIRDLGSKNGLVVNDRVFRNAAARLASGDTVRVGRTEIRAFDPLHPVPQERHLQKTHPLVVWLSRPLNVWASFVLALCTVTGWSYLEIWNTEPGPQLAAAAGGTLVFVLVWSALWAVAGRLIRHKSRFRGHVALISLTVVVSVGIFSYIESYTDFLTNGNWVGMALTYVLDLALLAVLLYGSLSLATDMPQRRKMNASAYFSAGIMIGIFALTQVAQRHFIQEPAYPSHLEPYLAGLAPLDSVDQFMKESDTLFDSQVFKTAEAKKK
ncbi:MAG: FHA domain-containing protein [Alphaproteobacteria bacterium]|nr:MAG: FHA domain-containing protein [Alphaproteobacteria bacterium]